MPNDSISILSDSVSLFPVDSLSNGLDSIATIAVLPPYGHEGIPLLALPQNQSWVFLLFAGLFLLFVFSVRMFPGLFGEDIKSVFRAKERASIFSKTTASDSRFQILFVLFAVCVISFYAYFVLYDPAQDSFTFLTYLYFFLATAAFFLLKYLFIGLLGYVFFDPKTIAVAKRSFLYIIILFGAVLFPLLVVDVYATQPISDIIPFVSLGVCVFIAILVVLNIFQIFFSKILDSFYILLYLCTLEILPVLGLFQVYQLIL